MDMQENLSLYEAGALSLLITHNKSPCAWLLHDLVMVTRVAVFEFGDKTHQGLYISAQF